MRRLITFSILSVLCTLVSLAHPTGVGTLKPEKQLHPLLFIENKGQIVDQHQQPRPDIDFKMQAAGLNIFVGDGQLHYQFSKSEIDNRKKAGIYPISNIQDPTSNIKEPTTIETYRMDVVLIGANKNATVIAEELQSYFENYYLPQVGVDGATAHSYTKITYKDIYPHIDWVLYSRNNELKYDFVVHAGGNPKDIQLQYNGATKLELKKGALMATTPMGSITEAVPYSYAVATGKTVKSNYHLEDNLLGFDVDNYSGELVIDPSLLWATYTGGNGAEAYCYTTGDSSGNIYLVGSTTSTNNIATAGAFQLTLTGNSDIFLVRYTRDGQKKWGTYCGGARSEQAGSITYDVKGSVYLAGFSFINQLNDSTMSTPGAFRRTTENNDLGFLEKFDTSGNRLWGTYYANGSVFASLTCDMNGNVYIAGSANADLSLASPGSFQSLPMGGTEAYMAKFSPGGTRLWGTYFGGTGNETMWGMRYREGYIYTGGNSSSTTLATAGAYKTVNSGTDALLTKWDTLGNLVLCTYYGGSNTENAQAIDVDSAGNIYIGGITQSPDDIATPGSFQMNYTAGNYDCFLAKFTPSGHRVWGTYFGGLGYDGIYDLRYNRLGKIYITGVTESNTGIATTGSYQDNKAGGSDRFLSFFDINGERLWGTYFGGFLNESWSGTIYLDSNKVVTCGGTASDTMIATPGSHQPTYGGGPYDSFLASFLEELSVDVNQPYKDTLLCWGTTLPLAYNITGYFNPGNVFTVQLSDSTGNFTAPYTLGTLASRSAGVVNCPITSAVPTGRKYRIRIMASDPLYTSVDNGKDITVGPGVTRPDASSNTPLCEYQSLALMINNPEIGLSYNWNGPGGFSSTVQNATVPKVLATGDYVVTATNSYGCKAKDTVMVILKPSPHIVSVTNSSPVCHESQLELKVQSDDATASYTWFKNGKVYTGIDITISKADKTNNGNYGVFATAANGCSSDTAITNAMVLHFEPKAGSNSMVKPGDTLKLWGENNFPDAVVRWDGPNGFTSDKQNPVIPDVDVNADGTYYFHVSRDGCTDSTNTYVMVSKLVTFNVYANPNDGNFTIEGHLGVSEAIPLIIVNDAGQVVYRDEIAAGGKHVKKTIALAGRLSNGMYTIKLIAGKEAYEVKMVISK